MVALSLIAAFLGVDPTPASLPVGDLEVGDALQTLIKSLGGLKGASALAIAVFVAQGVLLFFRTQLASFAGKWRLVIVTALTLVVGVLGLSMVGIPWTSALVHANTVTAFQVFIHQLIAQLSTKKDEPKVEPKVEEAPKDPS